MKLFRAGEPFGRFHTAREVTALGRNFETRLAWQPGPNRGLIMVAISASPNSGWEVYFAVVWDDEETFYLTPDEPFALMRELVEEGEVEELGTFSPRVSTSVLLGLISSLELEDEIREGVEQMLL